MATIMKERLPEVTLEVQGPETEKRGAFRIRAAWYLLLVSAIAFVGAGAYTVARGWDARAQVRAELLAQHIVTPEDASIPNARVDDAVTAQAQADIIHKHALKATGGKTYAQMERTDPARQVAFSAAALRTSLLSAVLAFNVANLAMGFGAFVAGVGLLGAVSLILLRPKFKTV